jgi:hypothetical protein
MISLNLPKFNFELSLLSLGFSLSLLVFYGCNLDKKHLEQIESSPVSVPQFNSDSAFWFVEKQVSFGPRIPGSPAHQNAYKLFVEKFSGYGWQIAVQEFEATTYDNQHLTLKNIIASHQPQLKRRILLAAHWDTRPYADRDPENKNATFDGANDGASGVAVLLEIARVINDSLPAPIGIDIILFDGEDWGEQEGENKDHLLPKHLVSWWCLGSQYWSRKMHVKNYSAMYGILLDMVGGRKAQFYREGNSMKYAPRIVDKVWSTAAQIGYSDYFIKQNIGAITDDHIFVNEIGKIPMIDIIPYQPGIGYFGEFHHTQNDNLSIISKETLRAVGVTILSVIYNEKP